MADSTAVAGDSGPSGRKLRLRSSDRESFEVDEEVAFRSETVKQMVLEVEATAADQDIDLPNVRAEILSKVIEYCRYHAEVDKTKAAQGEEDRDEDLDDEDDEYDMDKEKTKEPEDEVKAWDKEFVNVEQHILFDLLLAANYMNVKDLLDFLIQTVADMIVECKDPAEVRAKFNIPDDLTPEEVEEIKRKNTWAFE